MRLSSFSALTLSALLTGLTALTPLYPSIAAAQTSSVSSLQTQLQNEWSNFVAMLPGNVISQGQVSLTKDGLSYLATLPSLTFPLVDGGRIQLQSARIKATPDASGVLALDMTLPNAIKRLSVTDTESDAVTIGQHNIKATVKPTANGWIINSFDSQARTIKGTLYDDTTSVGQLTIKATPEQTVITAKDITIAEHMGNHTTIKTGRVEQNAQGNHTMRLSDVFGLLSKTLMRDNILKSWDHSAAGAKVTLTDVAIKDAQKKDVIQIGTVTTENKVTAILGNLLTMRSFGSLENIKTFHLPMFADILPQSVNFSTTTRNIPLAKIKQNLSKEDSRRLLSAAGTQVQIESLQTKSSSGLSLSGTGLLTSTTAAPTYLSGNINLTVSNLSDALAKLQTKVAADKKIGESGAAMMAIMMLQGMGRTSPDQPGQALYQVSFSPNGQITINDQDFSTLANLIGMGNAVRKAAPTAPATTHDAPAAAPQSTPASTPWPKK